VQRAELQATQTPRHPPARNQNTTRETARTQTKTNVYFYVRMKVDLLCKISIKCTTKYQIIEETIEEKNPECEKSIKHVPQV